MLKAANTLQQQIWLVLWTTMWELDKFFNSSLASLFLCETQMLQKVDEWEETGDIL